METYDVIVIGLGAMGSAAAYHLAKRGSKVSKPLLRLLAEALLRFLKLNSKSRRCWAWSSSASRTTRAPRTACPG
jgi:flavin-dependent dehydrogenase